MHLSENEGIEGNTFVVTGGLGFVGSALCLELVRRGARQVRAFDLRTTSPWSQNLNTQGVLCVQGNFSLSHLSNSTFTFQYLGFYVSINLIFGKLLGDVARKKDVERVVRGADCVFHLASYGMSGKEMLQFGRVDEININGTCHVLDACHDYGVKRLVYVSTYNVIFGGNEIVSGNESMPYFPIEQHVDSYGRSKSIAEQLVLKSNARPFK